MYDERLAELIHDGRLGRDEVLTARYKGRRYEARVQPDGALQVIGFGPAPTLSWAARLICSGERNGWRFWGVVRNNRWQPIADLRDG